MSFEALKEQVDSLQDSDCLADKHSSGGLTREAQAELESIVRANTLFGILKAEARSLLAHGANS